MAAVIDTFPLGFPWPTQDPFLFCVYHRDIYPEGNDKMGPAANLAGRNIGQDFALKNGWRMYHGQKVPGFPGHPHCGFETLTVVTEGWVDHADSLHAAGRYGAGDVQWMTAGSGIQHSEMFPLRNTKAQNPLELFQIWLNLPKKSKQAEPNYSMLWRENIPVLTQGKTQITCIAGEALTQKIVPDISIPLCPNDSWAAEVENEVAVWILDMQSEATFDVPTATEGVLRSLFFFEGDTLTLDNTAYKTQGFTLDATQPLTLKNGTSHARLLLLQGKPIKEPVVQYGPFVGNTRADIESAYQTYQKTEFGGWPWPNAEPVHGEQGRFARYPDGTIEKKS